MAIPVDDYLEKNDWYFTASKLKLFAKNPEEFRLQYVQKIRLDVKKRHFVMWNAFDDLVTYRVVYGNNMKYSYETEEWLCDNPFYDVAMWLQIKLKSDTEIDDNMLWMKVWLSKYYMDEWLVTDDLKRKLLERPVDKRFWYSDWAIKKLKLPQLRWIYYNDPWDKKIRLTPWESKKIMWMYREVLRQPKMDMFSRWWTQWSIETKYQWAKIRWTLDRFVFVDKNENRYLPVEVDEYIETEWRDARMKLVKNEGIYWIIRDWKTSGNMDTFEYDMEETFDYVMSMSFYFVLVLAKYWVRSHVFLDVLSKKEPYWSFVYRLKPDRIIDKLKFYIKPLIDDLIRAYEHNVREPIKPLTWSPVTRWEMMKSKYYPMMKWAIQDKISEPQW